MIQATFPGSSVECPPWVSDDNLSFRKPASQFYLRMNPTQFPYSHFFSLVPLNLPFLSHVGGRRLIPVSISGMHFHLQSICLLAYGTGESSDSWQKGMYNPVHLRGLGDRAGFVAGQTLHFLQVTILINAHDSL